MTEDTIAAMKETLRHVEEQLHVAAAHRNEQTAVLADLRERLARIEERQSVLMGIEREVHVATTDNVRQDALSDARFLWSKDRRGTWAVVLSFVAILVSIAGVFGWVGGE